MTMLVNAVMSMNFLETLVMQAELRNARSAVRIWKGFTL